MRSALHDASSLHDGDGVRPLHRAEPVRDDERRPPRASAPRARAASPPRSPRRAPTSPRRESTPARPSAPRARWRRAAAARRLNRPPPAPTSVAYPSARDSTNACAFAAFGRAMRTSEGVGGCIADEPRSGPLVVGILLAPAFIRSLASSRFPRRSAGSSSSSSSTRCFLADPRERGSRSARRRRPRRATRRRRTRPRRCGSPPPRGPRRVRRIGTGAARRWTSPRRSSDERERSSRAESSASSREGRGRSGGDGYANDTFSSRTSPTALAREQRADRVARARVDGPETSSSRTLVRRNVRRNVLVGGAIESLLRRWGVVLSGDVSLAQHPELRLVRLLARAQLPHAPQRRAGGLEIRGGVHDALGGEDEPERVPDAGDERAAREAPRSRPGTRPTRTRSRD